MAVFTRGRVLMQCCDVSHKHGRVEAFLQVTGAAVQAVKRTVEMSTAGCSASSFARRCRWNRTAAAPPRADALHILGHRVLLPPPNMTLPAALSRLLTPAMLREASSVGAARQWEAAGAAAQPTIVVLGTSPTAGCGALDDGRATEDQGMCLPARSWAGQMLEELVAACHGGPDPPRVHIFYKNAVSASYFERCMRARVRCRAVHQNHTSLQAAGSRPAPESFPLASVPCRCRLSRMWCSWKLQPIFGAATQRI